MTFLRSLAAVTLVTCCLAAPALAQKAKPRAATKAPTTEDCLACHGDASATGAGGKSIAVLPDTFGASVHGQAGLTCVDCHADLAKTADAHPGASVAPVNCATCHADQVKQYDASVHAVARRASSQSVAASCRDCHGAHDIRSSKDPESPTYHLTLPKTCGRCHGDAEIIKRGHIAIGNVVTLFQDSIHGRALSRSGLTVAPDCTACHGSHGIRRKTDSESLVYRTVVPDTCGRCHEGIARRYQAGTHGQAVRKGNPIAPVCVTCHTAHQIQRAENVAWKQQVLRECGSCHPESNKTFRDTFHGQETQLGWMRVADCADCHGAHDIFPKNDNRSLVSSANRVSTCRKCHAGANESFAKYDPHADKHRRDRNPLLFYAAKFMEALLIGVFAFFGLHTALWASRSVKIGGQAPPAAPTGNAKVQE